MEIGTRMTRMWRIKTDLFCEELRNRSAKILRRKVTKNHKKLFNLLRLYALARD